MRTLSNKKEPRKVAQRVTISNNYPRYKVPLFSVSTKSNIDDSVSYKSGCSYQSAPSNANYDELSHATDIIISGRNFDEISQETLELLPSYLDQTSLQYAGKKEFDNANELYSLIPKVKTELNKRSIIITRKIISEQTSYPRRTTNLSQTRKVNYDLILEKFDKDTANDEEKLLSAQRDEMEEFDRLWKEKIPEKYRKPSQNLLLLKKKQRILISQRKYVAAKELENEIKRTESLELKIQQERLNKDYSRAYKQIQQKHQKEIDCYHQERKSQRFVYEREQRKQIEIERKAQEIREIKMCETNKRISSMSKTNGARFLPAQNNNKKKSAELLLPKLGPPVLEKSSRTARSNSVKPNTARSVTVIRKSNYNDKQNLPSSRSSSKPTSDKVQLEKDIWGRANDLSHPNFSMKNAKEEFMRPKIKYDIKRKKPTKPKFAKRKRNPISFESESNANAEEDYYHYDEELKIDYLDIAHAVDDEISNSLTKRSKSNSNSKVLSRSVSWEAVDMNESSVLEFEEEQMEQPSHLSPSLFKPVLDSSQLPSEFRSPHYEAYEYDDCLYEEEEDMYDCESTRNHAAFSGPGSAFSSDRNLNDSYYRDGALFNAIPIEAYNPDDQQSPLLNDTNGEKLPTNSTNDSPTKENPNAIAKELGQEGEPQKLESSSSSRKTKEDQMKSGDEESKLLFQERLGLDMGNLFASESGSGSDPAKESSENLNDSKVVESTSSSKPKDSPKESAIATAKSSSKSSTKPTENASQKISPTESENNFIKSASETKMSATKESLAKSKSSAKETENNSQKDSNPDEKEIQESSANVCPNSEQKESSKPSSPASLRSETSAEESHSLPKSDGGSPENISSNELRSENANSASEDETFESGFEVEGNQTAKLGRNESENASAEDFESEEESMKPSDNKPQRLTTPRDSAAHLSETESNSDFQ